ncbi:hypothetical protein RRG08_036800 [Elysia crispata]|uniref:Uncharacterized protein n=1 Tax=Elysia crispata TaxID=231223 RepID=A0AAE1DW80_9GAST|nr:hypothetical protein RRG08_036800 [Elysia crispata]
MARDFLKLIQDMLTCPVELLTLKAEMSFIVQYSEAFVQTTDAFQSQEPIEVKVSKKHENKRFGYPKGPLPDPDLPDSDDQSDPQKLTLIQDMPPDISLADVEKHLPPAIFFHALKLAGSTARRIECRAKLSDLDLSSFQCFYSPADITLADVEDIFHQMNEIPTDTRREFSTPADSTTLDIYGAQAM